MDKDLERSSLTEEQYEEQKEIARIRDKEGRGEQLTKEERRRIEIFRRNSSLWDPCPKWGDGKRTLQICETCAWNMQRDGRFIDCGLIDDGETPITLEQFIRYSQGNCPEYFEDLIKVKKCEKQINDGKAKWGEWKKAGK